LSGKTFERLSLPVELSGGVKKMASILARSITIADLKSGTCPFINDREFAALRGCSVATTAKERSQKKGIRFYKDPQTGRVFYRAEDVVAYFDAFIPCTSTLDYDTREQQEQLERAREVAAAKREDKLKAARTTNGAPQ
jgi:hypothetical protein